MAKRIIQSKDEEIARRAMDLARQITGRVFISRGGLCLVSGSPEFQKFRSCLAELTEPPQDSAVPTPLDLGFQPSQIIPLNHENLSAWGRGLQKWRKNIEDNELPKAKMSERRQKFHQWKDEIELISHNLERLWDIYRKYEAGAPIEGAPYVRVDIIRSGNDISVPFGEPLWNWLERLLVWIAGENAGTRFHRSLLPFMESPSLYEKRRYFARALSRLQSLQKQVDWLSSREIVSAVNQIVNSIPKDVRIEFGFNLPERRCDLDIKCIMDSCIAALEMHLPAPQLVVSAAILCASDGATIPLPEWLFRPEPQVSLIRTNAFQELYDQHQQPGYEKLLCALPDMSGVSIYDFGTIRKFLLIGEDIKSIRWALQHLGDNVDDLAKAGLSPQPFRSLISALEKAGMTSESRRRENTDLVSLVSLVCKRKSIDIIKTYVMWLQSLDPASLNLNLARQAWNSLFPLLNLVNASPSFKKTVKRWTKPPQTDGLNTLVDDAPPEVYSWLSRLSYYLELCGKKPALPTVSKMLCQVDRQQLIEHLRKMRDAGHLNEQAAASLELLESHDSASHKPAMEHLLKQLREVCAHTALEAIRNLTWQESQRIWARLFGGTPPAFLSEEEMTAIVTWSRGLKKEERELFDELIDGWKLHGTDYRLYLSRNCGWIKTASERINIKAWFDPEAREIAIDSLSVRICVVPDPFRIFLMGNDFGAYYLRLDKFDRNSVLANAYDANKTVIFAISEDGRVLARKLVCVSSDYKLIGYEVHFAYTNAITSSRREKLAQVIEAFFIDLAQQTGMQPGDDGTPEELSGLFWHDDNVCPLKPGDLLLHPVLQEAFQEHRQLCINLLNELGIWPPANSNGKEFCLESNSELAEECLAVLARTHNDRQLARLVFQNAMTNGGKIEAMTSLALLEKNDEMAEYVYDFIKKHYDFENYDFCDRGMAVLRQMGTSKAWQLFMKIGADGDEWWHFGIFWWLVLAAADSHKSAHALFQILRSPNALGLTNKPDRLLLLGELLALRGWPLPQDVLIQVYTAHIDNAKARLGYAQWGPSCPDVMKRQNMLKLLDEVDGCPGSCSDLSVLSVVILGMKNQGARDMTFLKETASRNISALLALALQRESKYQELINKTALAFLPEPAALLALIESNGMENTEQLLSAMIKEQPGLAEKWQQTVALRHAFLQLDQGHPVSCLFTKEQLDNALPLLPYILFWLWKWTDCEHPNAPALAALAASDNLADLLNNAKVDKWGLTVRMATLLRFADDESAAPLRHALYAIINNRRFGELNDICALLVNKLSGYKLWIEEPAETDRKFSIQSDFVWSCAWEFLIDSDANCRPVVKWIESRCFLPYLPLDIRVAARAMILECCDDPATDGKPWFYPITEIQRQLYNVTRARSSVSHAQENHTG